MHILLLGCVSLIKLAQVYEEISTGFSLKEVLSKLWKSNSAMEREMLGNKEGDLSIFYVLTLHWGRRDLDGEHLKKDTRWAQVGDHLSPLRWQGEHSYIYWLVAENWQMSSDGFCCITEIIFFASSWGKELRQPDPKSEQSEKKLKINLTWL